MSTLKKYRPEIGPDFIATNFGRLRTARCVYDFAVDGGADALITPTNGETIPINAVVLGAFINVITAVTSGGSATVSVGLSAGAGGAAALLAATAKASLGTGLTVGVPTPAVPVKMSAAGKITFTPAVAVLTAGKIEVVVLYFQCAG
jgi:hypothetical protein